MTAASETESQGPDGDDHIVHGAHHDAGVPHATLKGYLTGFGLSVVLTAIPFWLVMGKVLEDKHVTLVIVLALAVIQIFVHMTYFLHLNSTSEAGWNMLAVIFTLVLVVIALTGSLWVMYHMHVNMMPMSPQDARTMP